MEPVVKLTRIKIYKCGNCTKVFPSTKQLANHSKAHKNASGVFKCKDCNSWFQTNKECTLHQMSHLPRKYNMLNSHSIVDNNFKPFNLKVDPSKDCPAPHQNRNGSLMCPKCDKELKTSRLYKRHYNIHHCTKYLCQFCDKAFGTKSQLIYHIKIHIDKIERPYKCDVCGKGFTQPNTVKIHIKRVHDRIFDHKCKYCKKAFPDRGALVVHVRTHTGYKPYECNYCTKTFSDPSAILRHIRTHTGEMKYACTECPMKFTDASGLIAHKKRHVGIKKFTCKICTKKFIDAHMLKTHVESIHERVKKYECDQCGKKFTTMVLLGSHARIYHAKSSGRFKCDHCGKILCTRRFFENHLFRVHKLNLSLEEKPKTDRKSRRSLKNKYYFKDHLEGNIIIKDAKVLNTFQEEANPLFECHYCEKEFNERNVLEAHIHRFHGKENDEKVSSKRHTIFDCNECGKKCKSDTSLRKHVKRHKNASYCNICEAELFTKKDLQRHKIKCSKKFTKNCQKIKY